MKVQPENETRREAFRCESLFLNESAFYNRVIPALQEYTEERTSLPFPVCYFASNNAIVLEDLTPVSYTHLDVYKRQSLHCKTTYLKNCTIHE